MSAPPPVPDPGAMRPWTVRRSRSVLRDRWIDVTADAVEDARGNLLDPFYTFAYPDWAQVVAVTDPLQVGFSRQAMVGVRADGDLVAVADQLGAIDEVEYVVITAGSFDILCELVCEDDDHLLRVLSERIRVLPGVRDTETFVYLQLAKQTYAWGTR